jgi:hypothetical protein
LRAPSIWRISSSRAAVSIGAGPEPAGRDIAPPSSPSDRPPRPICSNVRPLDARAITATTIATSDTTMTTIPKTSSIPGQE